jgi:mannose-6-phosphate isomerase-like protein (cupin superfamily)
MRPQEPGLSGPLSPLELIKHLPQEAFAASDAPPHRHRRYSEQIYVLEGEFTVWSGKRQTVLRRGEDVVIPPGIAHAFHVTGDAPVRALVVASPSAFARLVTEVGTPDHGSGVPPSAPPDMDLFHRSGRRTGSRTRAAVPPSC